MVLGSLQTSIEVSGNKFHLGERASWIQKRIVNEG